MKIKIKITDESIHLKHLLLSPELLGGLFIQVNVRVIVGSISSSIKVIALSICSAKWPLNNHCFYSKCAHRIIEFDFFFKVVSNWSKFSMVAFPQNFQTMTVKRMGYIS